MATLTGLIEKLFHQEPASCLACGDCCRQFSWHLKASERDIRRWKELGRQDLLDRVNYLGWIWVDPETKQRLPVCPFLTESECDKALCAIHDIKPDICRSYPTYEAYHLCIKGIHFR